MGKAIDCNGIEIRKGDKVIWTDPQTSEDEIFDVYEKPTDEMLKLCNEYTECEALPKECRKINKI